MSKDAPSEMPEEIFRASEDFREVRALGRAVRLREVGRGADAVATMAARSTSGLFAVLASVATGSPAARRLVIAGAALGWLVVLAAALKWGGLV